MHHFIPSDNKPQPLVTGLAYDKWTTLDATLLRWFISFDFLNTIMELGSTTLVVWKRLVDLLQDNHNTHDVTLKQEFFGVCMKAFPNVSTYSQRLKTLSNQLHHVGALVNNHCLVLKLISNLIDAYLGVSTLIR